MIDGNEIYSRHIESSRIFRKNLINEDGGSMVVEFDSTVAPPARIISSFEREGRIGGEEWSWNEDPEDDFQKTKGKGRVEEWQKAICKIRVSFNAGREQGSKSTLQSLATVFFHAFPPSSVFSTIRYGWIRKKV